MASANAVTVGGTGPGLMRSEPEPPVEPEPGVKEPAAALLQKAKDEDEGEGDPAEASPPSPGLPSKPRFCCKAMTKGCLACAAGVSVEDFCAKNAGKYDCQASPPPRPAPTPRPTPRPTPPTPPNEGYPPPQPKDEDEGEGDPAEADCVDSKPAKCRKFVKFCKLPRFAKKCPQSCGLCDMPKPTLPPIIRPTLPPIFSCKDRSSKCPKWAEKGWCTKKKKKGKMFHVCPLSCKVPACIKDEEEEEETEADETETVKLSETDEAELTGWLKDNNLEDAMIEA